MNSRCDWRSRRGEKKSGGCASPSAGDASLAGGCASPLGGTARRPGNKPKWTSGAGLSLSGGGSATAARASPLRESPGFFLHPPFPDRCYDLPVRPYALLCPYAPLHPGSHRMLAPASSTASTGAAQAARSIAESAAVWP